MKLNIKILSILVLATCCFASCKTINVGNYEQKKDIMRSSKIVDDVISSTPKYNFATYKFSAEASLNGASPSNFSGTVRVHRDSTIWVSIRSFNIEGMRALITPDSVKMVDRLNNKYYDEPISTMLKIIGVDITYDELQGILLNEFFFYPTPNDVSDAKNNYNSCNDSVFYCVSAVTQKKARGNAVSQGKNETAVQTIKIVPGTMKVKSVFLEDVESTRYAFIKYANYKKFGDDLFPQSMVVEIGSDTFGGVIKFNISDFEVPTELTFPFKIPAKYEKVVLNGQND
ncbi:MAG: DUF4292 domain-containing protein [Bacteroidales bacterium]|nr:DUF4292 domain-containing protein [Bacteroidales bacterium]